MCTDPTRLTAFAELFGQQSNTSSRSGHSFSGIADTAGDLVLLDGLPKTLTIDPTNSTVTVTSGMSYTELTARLASSGLRISEHGLNPADISIAGACATGTHGSGDDQRRSRRLGRRHASWSFRTGTCSSCDGTSIETRSTARWSRSALLAS